VRAPGRSGLPFPHRSAPLAQTPKTNFIWSPGGVSETELAPQGGGKNPERAVAAATLWSGRERPIGPHPRRAADKPAAFTRDFCRAPQRPGRKSGDLPL